MPQGPLETSSSARLAWRRFAHKTNTSEVAGLDALERKRFTLCASAPSDGCRSVGRCSQNHASNFRRQNLRRKRLLEKADFSLKDSLTNDRVVGISRNKEYLHVRPLR